MLLLFGMGRERIFFKQNDQIGSCVGAWRHGCATGFVLDQQVLFWGGWRAKRKVPVLSPLLLSWLLALHSGHCQPVALPLTRQFIQETGFQFSESYLPCQWNPQIEKQKPSTFVDVLLNTSNSKLVSVGTCGEKHQTDKTWEAQPSWNDRQRLPGCDV